MDYSNIVFMVVVQPFDQKAEPPAFCLIILKIAAWIKNKRDKHHDESSHLLQT
jgi:hypothetical protein